MLANTEATLISTISTTLGANVPTIARHPGRWDSDNISSLLNNAPAVYISFSQGRYQELWSDQLLGRWHIYLVARHLNSSSEPGIYQMIEQLLPVLHGLEFGQEDVLRLRNVSNLLNFKNLDLQLDISAIPEGYSIYQLTFELPMRWPAINDPLNSIDPWQRYTATHTDLNQTILATDQAELPQGETP